MYQISETLFDRDILYNINETKCQLTCKATLGENSRRRITVVSFDCVVIVHIAESVTAPPPSPDANRDADPSPAKSKFEDLDFDQLLKQAQKGLKR